MSGHTRDLKPGDGDALAAALAGAASGASTRAANCGGFCLYAPTAGGWRFDALLRTGSGTLERRLRDA